MESTLSLQITDLNAEVGLFVGYGRGVNNGDPAWTKQQQDLLDSICKSGIRQVLFPPPLEGMESSYDWSFLKPRATVDFPPKASTIPLPDDFGGFEGQITLSAATGQMWWPINLMNEGRVAQLFSETPTATGRPWIAALQWLKPTTATSGQRAQLYLFPAADTDYKLQFQYYFLPNYLDGAFPFPLGGMLHAELFLESCLAVAERRLDDLENGPHKQAFMERLAASVSADRRNKPQVGGYNGDRSDLTDRWGRTVFNHFNDRILINGQSY
jgi:hypothetical protein